MKTIYLSFMLRIQFLRLISNLATFKLKSHNLGDLTA